MAAHVRVVEVPDADRRELQRRVSVTPVTGRADPVYSGATCRQRHRQSRLHP